MGQQISALVDSIENDEEKEKLANDALNSLVEISKVQINAFKLSISNSNFDADRIPIDQIIYSDSIIQANFSSSPADIGKVMQSFTNFAQGEVAKGIASLLSSGLDLLLGSYEGNSSTRDTYLISTGSLGGQVLAVSIVISSVDLSKVDDNSLRVIVQETYSSSSPQDLKRIYAQIKSAKDSDKKSDDTLQPLQPDTN
ncbi:hypothetical protein BDD12DRAFT_890546 [Trichophaea hybrida]|nr:hypothetical protein BDD12DRAFT_890546 [Trichophaea hybrida]